MSRKGHRGQVRKTWKESKRYEQKGLEYATDKAFKKYEELKEKAFENGRNLREEFSRTDIRNMIESEHSAGLSWEEASKTTTAQAFRDSFNVYASKVEGGYDLQVLSEKQASNWLNRLKANGENVGAVTVEDIMTGKFDVRAYWGSLTAGMNAAEIGIMAQYFFGSD